MIQALYCWGSAPQGCHSDAIACLTSVASFLDGYRQTSRTSASRFTPDKAALANLKSAWKERNYLGAKQNDHTVSEHPLRRSETTAAINCVNYTGQ